MLPKRSLLPEVPYGRLKGDEANGTG